MSELVEDTKRVFHDLRPGGVVVEKEYYYSASGKVLGERTITHSPNVEEMSSTPVWWYYSDEYVRSAVCI